MCIRDSAGVVVRLPRREGQGVSEFAPVTLNVQDAGAKFHLHVAQGLPDTVGRLPRLPIVPAGRKDTKGQ
eukprot:15059831-Alexandrium_andersonii.AAC.1